MWGGYSKEEAFWVPAKDLTEIAIRSVYCYHDAASSITKVKHFTDVHYRFYHEPQPQERTILDAISSFSVAIHGSLSVGLFAKWSLTIEFSRQVFIPSFSKMKVLMLKENLGNSMREVTFYVTISLTVIFLTTLRMAMAALFLFQY